MQPEIHLFPHYGVQSVKRKIHLRRPQEEVEEAQVAVLWCKIYDYITHDPNYTTHNLWFAFFSYWLNIILINYKLPSSFPH